MVMHIKCGRSQCRHTFWIPLTAISSALALSTDFVGFSLVLPALESGLPAPLSRNSIPRLPRKVGVSSRAAQQLSRAIKAPERLQCLGYPSLAARIEQQRKRTEDRSLSPLNILRDKRVNILGAAPAPPCKVSGVDDERAAWCETSRCTFVLMMGQTEAGSQPPPAAVFTRL